MPRDSFQMDSAAKQTAKQTANMAHGSSAFRPVPMMIRINLKSF